MSKETLSFGMHDQTERPGQKLPLDAHKIIKQRYLLAEKLSSKKSVLEVGAGHGIAVNLLSGVASDYIAGEFSNENIRIINDRGIGNLKFVQMDAHNIPFKNKSFDLIIAMAMIYYLDIEKFLTEVKRLLKPNGVLFFCTSNKSIAGFVPAPYTTGYYSVSELNNILVKHGFENKFYGGFLSPGKTGIYRKLRAYIRDIAKYFLFKLPFGAQYWEKMRNRSLGGVEKLPWNVEDIGVDEEDVDSISSDVDNKTHRIIYCEARKLN